MTARPSAPATAGRGWRIGAALIGVVALGVLLAPVTTTYTLSGGGMTGAVSLTAACGPAAGGWLGLTVTPVVDGSQAVEGSSAPLETEAADACRTATTPRVVLAVVAAAGAVAMAMLGRRARRSGSSSPPPPDASSLR